MSSVKVTADTAFQAADRIRGKTPSPWEVFGERQRRFELHFAGTRIEMTRGPIDTEGIGLRVLRPREGAVGVGFASSTELDEPSIKRIIDDAESAARLSTFPAPRVELPADGPLPTVESADQTLWERPHATASAYLRELWDAVAQHPGITPSFGSIRLSLSEVTLANSSGLSRSFPLTTVDFEVALKASGGPAGAPPGEFWVNRRSRKLVTEGLQDEVARWARFAEDARHAVPPANGPQRVLLPTSVMADFVPAILGFRFSGAAKLRQMMPPAGETIAPPIVSIHDDGTVPFGLGTAPCDDEGTPQGRHSLIEGGVVREGLFDALHAAAFDTRPSGNGRRESTLYPSSSRFIQAPVPEGTNIVLSPGDGGTDEELIETAGEGIWVEQLGYAFPDNLSGAFGGEIRIGYRIHRGRLAEPLRGGTVGHVLLASAGQPSMLQSISAVGSQMRLEGHLSSAACVFEGVPVAGA